MAERELILFCDESDREGSYYSNFFGGLLVGSSVYGAATKRLNALKSNLNLHAEVKWSKVTAPYLGKYEALVGGLFDEIRQGNIKIRIMFSQNARKPVGLSDEQKRISYWLLYYQFVKHAFGLEFFSEPTAERHLRLYFDQFPDTGEQASQFKGYIHALEQSPGFRNAMLKIRREDIAEVRSHEHVLLQCLDIILGAMTFRLNDKHLAKPLGSVRRGSRTVAKEKLYKSIHRHICSVKPNFNIGITTGGGPMSRWELSYGHWLFVPRQHSFDKSKTKKGQKKSPARPT